MLTHRCDWLDGTVIAVHDFSEDPADVRLDVGGGDKGEELMDVFSDREYDPPDPGDATLHIAGYGYRGLRAQAPVARPSPREDRRR